jgi:hypothetical protein
MQTVDDINKSLIDLFGIDTESSNPIWRVVWSQDQFEWRHGTYTDYTPNGLFIREVTETRWVPKYRQWITNKYVLERLVAVPEMNLGELTVKKSYEPIYPFEDKDGNALPPKFEACQFVINTIYAAQYGTHNLRKYNDPDCNQETELENRRKRVDGLVEELFGEQSSLEGTTVTGESIIVPRNYEKVN